jgi:hypothetical protein
MDLLIAGSGVLVELQTAKEASETAASKLGETFQSLADAALRSNQGAFLDAARATLETVRAEMTGDLAQKQTAIEGVVKPLGDTLLKLESQVRELDRERQRSSAASASRFTPWRRRPARSRPPCDRRRPADVGAR